MNLKAKVIMGEMQVCAGYKNEKKKKTKGKEREKGTNFSFKIYFCRCKLGQMRPLRTYPECRVRPAKRRNSWS